MIDFFYYFEANDIEIWIGLTVLMVWTGCWLCDGGVGGGVCARARASSLEVVSCSNGRLRVMAWAEWWCVRVMGCVVSVRIDVNVEWSGLQGLGDSGEGWVW